MKNNYWRKVDRREQVEAEQSLGGGGAVWMIVTSAGDRQVEIGDWIVCEADGAIHIVSPDEFAGNYERPVEPARKKNND